MNKIESIQIRGFRSLADVELTDLPNVSVLIGPNGSGKSNIIRFFGMLRWMLHTGQLGEFVARQGGADDQLFRGGKTTSSIEADLNLNTNVGRIRYQFKLGHAHPDRFIFEDEGFCLPNVASDSDAIWHHLGRGHHESLLLDLSHGEAGTGVDWKAGRAIRSFLSRCHSFQFHDTSDSSPMKQFQGVWDRDKVGSAGGNLAPILLWLEREDHQRYELIRRQIGRILPMFDRFDIDAHHGKALLRWRAKGSDKTIGGHLTSDGSLRFFALVTLLNLPPQMLPDVLLLDEPELGLHPEAVELVGAMIRRVGLERQVIVATQSPTLVDVFDLDQVIVLDLEDGRTTCRQLNPDDYRQWLEDDFSPSDLWWKNVLGGNP